MRHKQRPIKSSRHKSVTSLNDCPQTSFEHNTTRHMNDVMRLAFLENNDISPDTWKEEIDFNSLSTATILKRNIQQHLQQQLKEQQSQLKQQQQQQQLFQQQLLHQQQQLARQYNNYEDDYGTSECQIFLADMPTTSYGHQDEQYDDIQMELQPPIPQAQRHVAPKRGSRKSIAHAASSNVSQMSVPELSIIHAPQAMRNEIKPIINHESGGFLCDEPDCGKVFPSLRKLRHHKVVHSDDFPFVCQFKGCGKKFKRKFGIDLHSTTHFDLDPEMYNKTSNNSSLPFFGRRMQYSMCKPCNVKFKTVHEYQFHMTKHGKEAFKCPVKGCGQTFNIWKSFQKHRASHYFNYYCKMDDRCDHSTTNLQLLKLHIYCCHFRRTLPENATLSSRDAQLESTSRDDQLEIEDNELSIDDSQMQIDEDVDDMHDQGQDQETQDEQCDQQSIDTDDYNYDDGYPATESQIFATEMPTTSYEPDESYEEPPMDLQRTPKRGSRKSANLTQMSLPDDESFIHTPQSTRHDIKPIQDQSAGFLCDEPDCGKVFPSLRKLRHHKVVHSDEFPFVCQFEGCGKKFKRKFGIDLHSTTHFDLDPEMYNKTSNNSSLPFFGRRMQYSMCKPCNVKFKTVHEYQFHMTKHGKEAFKCPVKGCGQTFNIWKSFQKHRASHYFNYYCKLDPQCDHSTSNLQLLKLHIYCCHFQRKLPANATLSSKDPPVETPVKEEKIDIDDSQEELPSFDVDDPDQSEAVLQDDVIGDEEQPQQQQQSVEDSQKSSQKSTPSTPRRDPRLRRNPPRSSTFNQQDYASMSNGISLAKLTSLSPPVKKQRVVDTQSQTPDKRNISKGSATKSLPNKRASTPASSQTTTTTSSTSPKKGTPKLPVKVLPKRSAQRLPMSMIAAEERTDEDEDDEGISDTESSLLNNGSRASNHTGDSVNKLYECHLCDYVFHVRFQLIKHLSTHLELSPEMYSATADAKVISLSERRRREFYCDKCPAKFEYMNELDNHVRKHGPRPYVCTFCPAQPSTFRYAKQYLSHLYEHRFNYKCCMQEDCDFTINRKDALKLHIFRIHLNHQLPAYIENYASIGECNNEWSEQ